MRILFTASLAFILRALQALLEIVLIRTRLFIAIGFADDLIRGTKRSTADLATPII